MLVERRCLNVRLCRDKSTVLSSLSVCSARDNEDMNILSFGNLSSSVSRWNHSIPLPHNSVMKEWVLTGGLVWWFSIGHILVVPVEHQIMMRLCWFQQLTGLSHIQLLEVPVLELFGPSSLTAVVQLEAHRCVAESLSYQRIPVELPELLSTFCFCVQHVLLLLNWVWACGCYQCQKSSSHGYVSICGGTTTEWFSHWWLWHPVNRTSVSVATFMLMMPAMCAWTCCVWGELK